MSEPRCPECGWRVAVPNGFDGADLQCPLCGAKVLGELVVRLRDESLTADSSVNRPLGDDLRVSCKACNKGVKVPASARGRMLRCPRCGTPVELHFLPDVLPATDGARVRRTLPLEDTILDHESSIEAREGWYLQTDSAPFENGFQCVITEKRLFDTFSLCSIVILSVIGTIALVFIVMISRDDAKSSARSIAVKDPISAKAEAEAGRRQAIEKAKYVEKSARG